MQIRHWISGNVCNRQALLVPAKQKTEASHFWSEQDDLERLFSPAASISGSPSSHLRVRASGLGAGMASGFEPAAGESWAASGSFVAARAKMIVAADPMRRTEVNICVFSLFPPAWRTEICSSNACPGSDRSRRRLGGLVPLTRPRRAER